MFRAYCTRCRYSFVLEVFGNVSAFMMPGHHMNGGGAVHALRTRGDATENVTRHDDGQFDAGGGDFGDLIACVDDGGTVDAKASRPSAPSPESLRRTRLYALLS